MSAVIIPSLTPVRFYRTFDKYFYDTDNRPLRDLQARDEQLAAILEQIAPETITIPEVNNPDPSFDRRPGIGTTYNIPHQNTIDISFQAVPPLVSISATGPFSLRWNTPLSGKTVTARIKNTSTAPLSVSFPGTSTPEQGNLNISSNRFAVVVFNCFGPLVSDIAVTWKTR